jgi:hypothetical protein
MGYQAQCLAQIRVDGLPFCLRECGVRVSPNLQIRLGGLSVDICAIIAHT